MQTGKEVTAAALKLMGSVNSYGAADENESAMYYGLAAGFINILVHEIAVAENPSAAPANFTKLDAVPDISEESIIRVLPVGLAMYFAVVARDNELYNFFSQLYYGTVLPTVKSNETIITDYYSVTGDITMQ